MTRRQVLLIVAVVIAATAIGIWVSVNTRAAFANLPPTVEPPVSPLATVAPSLSNAPYVLYVPWLEARCISNEGCNASLVVEGQ